MLTDMVEMLTNVNQLIDQDLVDILTDRANMSTEGCLQYTRYKRFMIMHYLFCGQI